MTFQSQWKKPTKVKSSFSNQLPLSLRIKRTILSWSEPIVWVFDKNARTVLDLGSGTGKVMDLIKRRRNINYAVGVEIFNPYIKLAKMNRTHDKFILADIKNISFPKNSFDVCMSVHVIEHLTKSEGWKLLKNMERIAQMQVIVATPIGEVYHPAVDNNKHQLHKSYFVPEDFTERGYHVVRYGWKWLLGDSGLIGKTKNQYLMFLLYCVNILLTPIYFLFQNSCDYVFVASKSLNK